MKILLRKIIKLGMSKNQAEKRSQAWGYADPNKWVGTCQSGKKQSPIELSEAKEATLDPIIYKNYDKRLPAAVSNTGHSVKIQLDDLLTKGDCPSISGGNLETEYILDNIHFHWGAEHIINGQRFALEAHLVHYASKYGDFHDAVKHENGVAVLGTVYTISTTENKAIREVANKVIDITYKLNAPVKIPDILVRDFIPSECQNYYRYSGSLTTPTCNEGVIWTVFSKCLTITQTQLELLSNISEDGKELLKQNCRPLQELNGREVLLVSGTSCEKNRSAVPPHVKVTKTSFALPD